MTNQNREGSSDTERIFEQALTREIVEAGVAVRLFTISRRQLMLRAHEAGMSTRKLARLDGTVSPATIHSWLQLARDERAQTAGPDGDSGGAE